MNSVSNGLYEPGMIVQLFGLDPGYLPLLTTLHRSHKKIMLERSPLTEEQASAIKKLIISCLLLRFNWPMTRERLG